jgi:hypothetical protein
MYEVRNTIFVEYKVVSTKEKELRFTNSPPWEGLGEVF